MSFFGRFLGTDETHDVFSYAIVDDRVDLSTSGVECPPGFAPVAVAGLDEWVAPPRAVLRVAGRANWTDDIAYEVAHEISHLIYLALKWAQDHPDALAALDLSRDRTHDKDQGVRLT